MLQLDCILVVVCVFPLSDLSTVLLMEAGVVLERFRRADGDDGVIALPCFAVLLVMQPCCSEGSASITRRIWRGRITPETTRVDTVRRCSPSKPSLQSALRSTCSTRA